MQRVWLVLPLVLMLSGCGGQHSLAPSAETNQKGHPHGQSMGGAEALKTNFETLDSNNDGWVTHAEFKAHFPKVTKEGFGSLDLNLDGVLDSREWRHFKKVHGVSRYPDNAV